MAQETKKTSVSRDSVESAESLLTGINGPYLDFLYEEYRANPTSVDPSLIPFFKELGVYASQKLQGMQKRTKASGVSEALVSSQDLQDTLNLSKLIHAYREWGHFLAHLDPLALDLSSFHPELDPITYGFTAKDLDRSFDAQDLPFKGRATFKDILDHLKKTYCSTMGFEFLHIQDLKARAWLQEKIENRALTFTPDLKKDLLLQLTKAETFEKFLAVKFPGAKRFGLEGAESFIPLLEHILKTAVPYGLKEMVLGMAHRGRLNVLTNIIGKAPRALFSKFQGNTSDADTIHGSGDVKYHLGASSNRVIEDQGIHLSLTSNPSHLEAVNPVVVGKVRAKQAQLKDDTREKVLGILVHGDAAFAGQGIVNETLLLSDLDGYCTGGTLHIIINNQIGFTTSPHCSRSSPYSSEVAKTIQAPIFHVNGDDPEAVLWVTQLATEYRYLFKKDVVIDLYCYRRHGHNEMDEPTFTQPVMYREIREHKTTRELYSQKLIQEQILSALDSDTIIKRCQEALQQEFEAAPSYNGKKADWLEGTWSKLTSNIQQLEGSTGIAIETLRTIGAALVTIPEGFHLHSKLERLLAQKKEVFSTDQGCDWATAEALAFGSLVLEGHPVRLSGQDCGRGTFSHRHSVLIDQDTGTPYIPLNGISSQQAKFEVIDSPLAEASVLGFELGYSLADPYSLVLWEAQFGDFANGAQIIMDQFISCGEAKWLRLSALVMLLPHGYEGQGPEHSSSRLERYLQLCAEDNMIVANCTTGANYFHVLRRQIATPCRKPLVIMTPKSLLRDKHAYSSLKDMGPDTCFQKVLPDIKLSHSSEKSITRIILCSGKVAYDLMDTRDHMDLKTCIVIRLEQLHPFPFSELEKHLAPYGHATFIWCQEEPKNMGAWTYIDRKLEEVLTRIQAKNTRPLYAGRPESAATATGYHAKHEKEQQALVYEALGLNNTH